MSDEAQLHPEPPALAAVTGDVATADRAILGRVFEYRSDRLAAGDVLQKRAGIFADPRYSEGHKATLATEAAEPIIGKVRGHRAAIRATIDQVTGELEQGDGVPAPSGEPTAEQLAMGQAFGRLTREEQAARIMEIKRDPKQRAAILTVDRLITRLTPALESVLRAPGPTTPEQDARRQQARARLSALSAADRDASAVLAKLEAGLDARALHEKGITLRRSMMTDAERVQHISKWGLESYMALQR